MEFRWSMNNDDFKRMQNDLKSTEWVGYNCYCGVAVGSMLWEFTMDMNDKCKQVLIINVYEAGVKFSGYGYLDDGTPYDHVDCYIATELGLKTSGKFEEFKESVQNAIITLSADDKHLKEMMESNMKPMWKGFKEV